MQANATSGGCMKKSIIAVISTAAAVSLVALTAHARWKNYYWDYRWWSPRAVEVTVDTHTFTGTVESLNSTQLVITVTGRENYKTQVRWENDYVVRPIKKPVTTYEGYESESRTSAADSRTFKIAVSCRISTADNLHARLADIHVGDKVTISHSLDHKDNFVAGEITVNKSKKQETKRKNPN
jgi:hypothetical protein